MKYTPFPATCLSFEIVCLQQLKKHSQHAFLLLVLLLFAHASFSQKKDSTKAISHFSGSVSVTNNGFSFVPSFSLGEPAAIFNFNINGGKRFSFEPEFRFSLEGKPWSFIFIWRYKVVNKDKFKFTVGTHLPALNFKTVTAAIDGDSSDIIQSQRYFPVVELFPSYSITKNINVSLFYLYGHDFEKDFTKITHFLSLRTDFSDINLSGKYHLRFVPQVFYLKTDNKVGYYMASNLSLARKNFPLSISTMMTKAIQTDIAAKKFDWNISLSYSFNKKYVKQS